MMHIAVVEDQESDFKVVKEYIEKYGIENQVPCEIIHFTNGLNFLDEYRSDFDVIFMDVEMPHLDGINTSKKLREKDPEVALIFITGMMQYAIDGYEVNAMDFIVKPVSYFNFSKKLDKAFSFAERNKQSHLIFNKDGNTTILSFSEIFYVEKEKNYVVFHTEKGEFKQRTTLEDINRKLDNYGFVKCFSGCIVNLARITEIKKDSMIIHNELLPIARRQRKEFMERFTQYYGGTI